MTEGAEYGGPRHYHQVDLIILKALPLWDSHISSLVRRSRPHFDDTLEPYGLAYSQDGLKVRDDSYSGFNKFTLSRLASMLIKSTTIAAHSPFRHLHRRYEPSLDYTMDFPMRDFNAACHLRLACHILTLSTSNLPSNE